MPDFNANANVYVMIMKDPIYRQLRPARQPIHSGTVAECINWTLANHDGYPETYSVEVPLGAGFEKNELCFREIEDLARHPEFPK